MCLDLISQLFLNSPNVVASQWPCVSDDVFVLIRWCTMVTPSDRPSLYQLQHDEEYGILALLQRVKDTEKKGQHFACLFVCLFGWLVGWLVVCLFVYYMHTSLTLSGWKHTRLKRTLF